jgi:hypothetical protein
MDISISVVMPLSIYVAQENIIELIVSSNR